MAESFSVKAILSAKDSGFSSTLKGATKTLDSINSKIKGFSFGILTGAGQAAFNALKNGVSELKNEMTASNVAWKTFAGNMKILGKGEKEINTVKSSLQDYATKTVYSASDMASSYSQLAAVGIKSADKLVTGFGGLAGAAENPTQAMKTLSQQGVQMAAKPSVAWQDFKLMLEQTPAGMAAVAKKMNMTTSELVTAVQNGEVSTKSFFKAVEEVGNSKGFTKLATEYKSTDQAMGGLMETLSNKLNPAFEVLEQAGIKAISGIADKLGSIDGQKVADSVQKIVDKITAFGTKCQPYITAFKEAFSGVRTAVLDAFSAVGSSLAELNGEFGSTESVTSFKDVITSVADGIKTVAGFIKEHSGTIAKLIQLLPKVAAGFAAFKVAKTVAPFVGAFANGIVKLGSGLASSIGSKLFKVAAGQKTSGEAARTAANHILAAAKAFALMGVGVLAISIGFALLAQSAIALSNAGGGAIAVMAGLVVALVGLGVGMAFLLKTLAPMGSKLMPVATAMLAMGAAVLMVSIGFAVLAASSIALANAGGGAIAVMVGMVATIALLAVGAAALGASLTAGAVGFIAFGAAVLMVGAGFALIGVSALLAAKALTIVATVLPVIAASGLQGALAITALGASLLVFAVGAGVAGAACLVLGAGLIVAGAGVAVLAVGVLLASVAILAAAGALAVLNMALPLTVKYGASAAVSMLLLGAGFLVLGAGALVASAGVIAFGAAALLASAGLTVFGGAMIVASGGSLILAGSLKLVNSSMKSIAKNAKTTQKSLKSMNSSVDAVGSGLDAIGNKAKSAMAKLTSAFDNSASKAKSSGKKVGDGFTNGMKTGLAKAPTTAQTIIMAVNMRLLLGRALAYQSGSYISSGFAQGMLSQLAVIQSAANRMVAAADKAIRAKAKIHSPSRLSRGEGRFFGGGWVEGVLDKVKESKKAVEELVYIPQISTPKLAYSYAGELSEDYSYSSNGEYIIEVPLTVDGREFARATASYTQSELNRKQIRENRKKGRA